MMRKNKNCQRPQSLKNILQETIGSDSFSDVFYKFFVHVLVFMTPPSISFLEKQKSPPLHHKIDLILHFDPQESILLSSLRHAMCLVLSCVQLFVTLWTRL